MPLLILLLLVPVVMIALTPFMLWAVRQAYIATGGSPDVSARTIAATSHVAGRLYGKRARSSAMPQVLVMPANTRPLPTTGRMAKTTVTTFIQKRREEPRHGSNYVLRMRKKTYRSVFRFERVGEG